MNTDPVVKVETCLFCGRVREFHNNTECGEIRDALNTRIDRALAPAPLKFEAWLYDLLGVTEGVSKWIRKSQRVIKLWDSPFFLKWVTLWAYEHGKDDDDGTSNGD